MPDLEDYDRLPHGVRASFECPPLALIRAWKEDVLPEELVRDVAVHMSDCALCRTLLADLEHLPQPAITPVERDRIRRRLPLVSPAAEQHTGWYWYAAASAVAALVIVGVLLTVRQIEHPREAQNKIRITPPMIKPMTPPQISAQTVADTEVQVAKLAPPLDLSPGLVLRGEASTMVPDIQQLTPAFTAYNSGDYTRATQLFSQLAKQFPRSSTPFLYLGVTQLLTHNDTDALFNLKRAEQFAAPPEKDAASWYRLAASARAHAPDATQLAHSLCNRNRSAYAQQACLLEKTLLSNQK
jgi:hypothetical protein